MGHIAVFAQPIGRLHKFVLVLLPPSLLRLIDAPRQLPVMRLGVFLILREELVALRVIRHLPVVDEEIDAGGEEVDG